MNVKAILDEKGRDVVTVSGDTPLRSVIELLAAKRIGAAVVVDAGRKIGGILSERDIVRVLAHRGEDALSSPASATMTKSVTLCRESDTVEQVMAVMTERRFRHLPVEIDGKLAGIVSIGDVVRKRIESVEREAEEMKSYIAG
ncbi:CBS domain-containing protein [Pararhizobium mangrovi]|uniref:CBS domain-containing protein n=1 Tax=Pararhizobium mangrovi TaxID=2590452 RepID=A0A506UBC8_9HYPH|nr:CBS domain-containing protein [Pararhizobium mangrovi]TPW31240.1 CBS domain-containing protein [Pararhizobium mangrovi]